MITRTYPLEKINDAFDALSRGDNARGVITPAA
jgi:Zn-dependent alcohol dehydrogenase